MKTKICNHCKKEKPISEFSKSKKGKDGLNPKCKHCCKKYYQDNKEAILEKKKKYYQRNIEHQKEYRKEYYQKNKEKLREKRLEYYQDNREKMREICRKWAKTHPIKSWCTRTISEHKSRGKCSIKFKRNDLLPIAKKTITCPICDTKLNWEFGTKNGKTQSNSPSLDRINNQNVLTLKDIQIICHKCNATKQNRTMKEMFDWCENFIYKFGEGQ